MKPLKFSIPYNNDFKLLKELVKIKNLNGNKIEEIYLSPPQEYIGSGRIVSRFSKQDLKIFLNFCAQNHLKVNLLLNSSCEGWEGYEPKNIKKLIMFVGEMHNNWGLNRLTVGNPLLIKKIKENFKKIKITVSVMGTFIDSVQRALFFEKMGADVLTIDPDINRDLELLKKIKEAVNCKLKLMVNEACLFKCPFRTYHGNFMSHASRMPEKALKDYKKSGVFKEDCFRIRRFDPSQVLKSPWIRPEDVRKYLKITNFFKIVGRDVLTEQLINTIRAYLTESYKGNILNILNKKAPFYIDNNKNLEGFFEKVANCNKDCFKCHYCENLADKIIIKYDK